MLDHECLRWIRLKLTKSHRLKLTKSRRLKLRKSHRLVNLLKILSNHQKQLKTQKKRKDLEHRSLAWEHYEEIRNEAGIVVKARCIYYAKKVNAHSKIHGTSAIRSHVLTCLKNPHYKNIRQKLLTL